ncbi:MAG: hypothetical protein IJ509_02865 [Bacilli bacterium]|nr:hypothetical protein [Bacilli bacterium]
MEEVQVETLEIDGKDYILIDSLEKDNNKYFYFSDSQNPSDIQILKEQVDGEEKFFVSLDTENELNEALMIFGQKYKDVF